MTGSNRHRRGRGRSIVMGSLKAGGVVSVIKLPADQSKVAFRRKAISPDLFV
jgi:hypothetical protein